MRRWEPIIFVDDPIEIYMNTAITKMDLQRIRKANKMTQKDVSKATG